MGQDISKSITPPPLSLQDCVYNGELDIARYTHYRRQLDDQLHHDHFFYQRKRKHFSDHHDIVPKTKRIRRVKRHKLIVRDKNGNLREILPTDTLWYMLYVANPPRDNILLKQFHLRFRMPYDCFISLSNDLVEHELFKKITSADAVGHYPTNLKLLLLGALRYIGRGWTCCGA